MGGVAESLALAPSLQGLDLGPDLGLTLARVLDDEDGRRVALDKAHPLRLLDVAAGQVEDQLVSQLDGVGLGLEN
jgi:hypothetical protein